MGPLRIEVLTLFPDIVAAYCDTSVIGRGRRAGLVDIRVHDLRIAAEGTHRSVDDAPFGGGAGMVLAPEPVFAAVEMLSPVRPLYLMSPAGQRFGQAMAEGLASGGAGAGGFSLLCGRYEGVDQRITDHLVDGEISLGDYVLAGGELAALAIVEATVRLVPGILGNEDSSGDESFRDDLLEYPQYTRPAHFRGWDVPEILRLGDHALVARWRHAQALARTLDRRPDLIESRGGLSGADRRLLEEFGLG
ncbi:MAG: tRNA (guanosine(37)-N1)-methyltransferase TrmD [Acidimicrobiales bacterium]